MAAARAVLADSNRYPDGGTHLLREALAERRGVSQEEIFVGLGSSEIIGLASRGLLRAGLPGVACEGTYAPFFLAVAPRGAGMVVVAPPGVSVLFEAIATTTPAA